MKVLFLLLSFSLLSPLNAQIEVTQVRGKVLFNKKPLKVGEILKSKGKIITGRGSLCRLSLNKGSSKIIVGPGSIYRIETVSEGDEPNLISLLKGSLRYYGHEKKDSKRPQIRTKQMSLGIRGTDFLLMTNPTFDESEIIIFDGLVRLSNSAEPRNRIDVKTGQWGGLGGRFGDRFQNPINLPKKVLTAFEKQLKK